MKPGDLTHLYRRDPEPDHHERTPVAPVRVETDDERIIREANEEVDALVASWRGEL